MGLLEVFKKKQVPMVPDIKTAWDNCAVDPKRIAEVIETVSKIKKNMYRYRTVANFVTSALGDAFSENERIIFARLIGCYHYREASLNFECCLHNGDRVIGNGKLTTNEPKNRGPFTTWEMAAVDALLLERKKFPARFDIYGCLELAEKFNGLGYRSKIGDHGVIELSPYVWAGTNQHDETGKYTSDGKYNPDAKEMQLGIAALMKEFEHTDEKLSVA